LIQQQPPQPIPTLSSITSPQKTIKSFFPFLVEDGKGKKIKRREAYLIEPLKPMPCAKGMTDLWEQFCDRLS
jgi:hypothetical protein